MKTKLSKILANRNMTQKDLLVKIQETSVTPIPQYAISNIVSGKSVNYSMHTLIRICRALEVTPNEVISKEDYTKLFKKSCKKDS